MSRVIMIQGTMSSAGKSFLAAGLCRIFKEDGCIQGRAAGTYVHGFFDSQEIQRAVWELLAGKYGISMDKLPEAGEFSMAAHKEEQYKKLAGILRENLDMDRIYGILDRRL